MHFSPSRCVFALALAWLPAAPSLAQGPPPALVRVEIVRAVDLVPSTLILGTTEPRRRSVVAAAIQGVVVDYPVQEGQRVKEGHVLARLRDTSLRLRIAEAKAGLEELHELHRRAERDLERARKLIAEDAVPQKTLDDAITQERTQALQVPQAEARLSILEADLAKKQILSPYDGQIIQEHAQLGEWLAAGGAVVTLVDIRSVFVRVHVPERYVRFAQKGASLRVYVAAVQKEPFQAKTAAVSDEGDPAARTFAVRVEVENTGHLRAGMTARVEFPTDKPREALAVSKDAVLQRGDQRFVFVVGEGNQAEMRAVDLGASSGSRFEVTRGLELGDRVVVEGNERLQPGATVRILDEGGRQE